MNDTVDVAVDATGKLFVANDSVSVVDTAHGNAVLPAISGGGLSGPYGVAIDARGKLYVANTKKSSLSVFDTAHGNVSLLVITRSLRHPSGVTVH
jgi:DNA-binding beta-propeller fold protein YncE